MRTLIRHAIALLLFTFICKVALQAQNTEENNGVPKSLLLGSMTSRQPIPTGQIDARRIIAAIRNE
ncbi:MAG: hypothetical protein ACXVB9_19155 [Bdellovibrionota bacterium]